jgi:alpha-beta hydrolase superfamily lysophospholipase
MSIRFTLKILKAALIASGYAILGATVLGTALYIHYLNARPALQVWHEAPLAAEYTSRKAQRVADFDSYLRLEQELFTQLDREVYERVPASQQVALNRYHRGSLSDPRNMARNWNRSFEMPADHPAGGALLIHGMSDSPYSMRPLAQWLHQQGFWVVALRLPGHGTAPVGLTRATAEDFFSAVLIGVRRVRDSIGPEAPFYIAGYSTGAALAVDYSLSVLESEGGTLPKGLILISPAIGVSPVAALAVWQARLSAIPGLEKLAWNSILLEYDPYKYNSFAVNAGDQVYRLTEDITRRLARLDKGGGVTGFPRVLALQSVADATVSTDAVVSRFLSRLAPEGHELVLFDVNETAEAEQLLQTDPEAVIDRLLAQETLPFGLTVVGNSDRDDDTVVARHKPALSRKVEENPTGLRWPSGVYSLSHVALPFPPDDPVYGQRNDPRNRLIELGGIELRGERGWLSVPAADLTRLRYNPFYAYMIQQIGEFIAGH